MAPDPADRPRPFEVCTAADLWTDEHASKQMLSYHLNGDVDLSSRKTTFIERSVAWIASHFNIGPETKVADFGCGPGLYTTRLAETGADVTGIDFSERSIAYARETAAKKGLSIRYVVQNYLEFSTEDRFDLIMMIMCDFCALGPDQRRKLLTTFRDTLAPNGAVLLDVYSLSAFEKREEFSGAMPDYLDGFWSPDPCDGSLNTFLYRAEKVALDRYTIVEANRQRTVYNWLQYFSLDDLTREFEAAGLAIDSVFANVAGDPYDAASDEFAVVAKRAS